MPLNFKNETPKQKEDRELFSKDYFRFKQLKSAIDLEVLDESNEEFVDLKLKLNKNYKETYLDIL